MNCDCIETVRTKILETQPIKNQVVTDVSLPVVYQMSGVFQQRLKLEASLTLEGRKTPYKIDLSYAYCPFCGQPAERKVEG